MSIALRVLVGVACALIVLGSAKPKPYSIRGHWPQWRFIKAGMLIHSRRGWARVLYALPDEIVVQGYSPLQLGWARVRASFSHLWHEFLDWRIRRELRRSARNDPE